MSMEIQILFGQAQKCGEVKLVYRNLTLPFLTIGSSMATHLYTNDIKPAQIHLKRPHTIR